MTTPTCPGCDKPEPNDYCWAGYDWDCPIAKPPRWASADGRIRSLWDEIRRLRNTVNQLHNRTENLT
jgi:hypothetical protein